MKDGKFIRLKTQLFYLGMIFLVGVSFVKQGLASEDTFLQQLKRSYLLTEPQAANSFMQQVLKDGKALQTGTDKEMRTIFVRFQAQMEREMLERLIKPQAGLPSNHIRSIWIIHTPLIATPLVTEGEVSPQLIATKVLKDKDKQRVQTSLERAVIMREYLAHGGVLIATYVADPSGTLGRTPEQMAVFQKLKQQYPRQLIELPIPVTVLPEGKYPADKLGATYIVQQPSGFIFEMTNMGTQINTAPNGAKWGVWLQERHLPQGQTTQRLCSVFQFLGQANLKAVLKQHALNHQQRPQAYFTLLAPYLVEKNDQGHIPNLLCGENQ